MRLINRPEVVDLWMIEKNIAANNPLLKKRLPKHASWVKRELQAFRLPSAKSLNSIEIQFKPSGETHCPDCGSYGVKIHSGEDFPLESIE